MFSKSMQCISRICRTARVDLRVRINPFCSVTSKRICRVTHLRSNGLQNRMQLLKLQQEFLNNFQLLVQGCGTSDTKQTPSISFLSFFVWWQQSCKVISNKTYNREKIQFTDTHHLQITSNHLYIVQQLIYFLNIPVYLIKFI